MPDTDRVPPFSAEDMREAFVAIYEALSALKRAARVAGGGLVYEPLEADPIERLRKLLDLPE